MFCIFLGLVLTLSSSLTSGVRLSSSTETDISQPALSSGKNQLPAKFSLESTAQHRLSFQRHKKCVLLKDFAAAFPVITLRPYYFVKRLYSSCSSLLTDAWQYSVPLRGPPSMA